MDDIVLTRDDILSRLTAPHRYFIELNINTASNGAVQPIYNFIDAFNLVCPFVTLSHKVKMFFFSEEPAKRESDYLDLTFTAKNGAVHITQGETIYFFLNRSVGYIQEIQIAMYLEELVHAFMQITDEILVKKVVAIIYPKVYYDEINDLYAVAPVLEPHR